MGSSQIKEYRLREEEAASLDTWHVINAVIFRVADDAPSLIDSDAMEDFFTSILSVQAAAFSAWFTVNFAVVGGVWHIFECCCAPMVYKAIEGYEMLSEPHPAQCLRRACAKFPGEVVPRSQNDIEKFLSSYDDEGELDFEFEKEKKIGAFFDFEKLYREHRDCFVIPDAR
jgi:hypothetical protein